MSNLVAGITLLLGLAAPQITAQPVTPAKSGLISYSTGDVYLDDRPVERSATHFSDVKVNAVVRTDAGRAEVLLAPCMVLRLGEHSSFRMIDTSLTDTRLELMTGSAVADVGNTAHHTSLTLQIKQTAVEISQQGVYRIDAVPPQLKVFSGHATVQEANRTLAIGTGQLLTLDTAAPPVKLDKRTADALDAWSKTRSAILAKAFSREQNREAQQLSAAADAAATTSAGDPNPPPGEWHKRPTLAPPPSANYFPAVVSASFSCQVAR